MGVVGWIFCAVLTDPACVAIAEEFGEEEFGGTTCRGRRNGCAPELLPRKRSVFRRGNGCGAYRTALVSWLPMPVKSPLMSLEKFRNTVARLRPSRAAIKAYSIMSCPDSSATIRLSRRIILDSSRRRGSCVACIALRALQVLCVETRVCSGRLPSYPRKVLKRYIRFGYTYCGTARWRR